MPHQINRWKVFKPDDPKLQPWLWNIYLPSAWQGIFKFEAAVLYTHAEWTLKLNGDLCMYVHVIISSTNLHRVACSRSILPQWVVTCLSFSYLSMSMELILTPRMKWVHCTSMLAYRWYIINLSAASPAANSDGTNGKEMGSCWVVDREVWLQY